MDANRSGKQLTRESLMPTARLLARPSRFEPQPLTEWRPRGVVDEHAPELAEAMERARLEGLLLARSEVDAAVQAHEDARRDLLDAAASLSRAVEQLIGRDQDDLHDLERQAIGFGVALAEELVGRELATVDEQLLASIARAIDLAPDRGPIIVRVHPLDAQLARSTMSNRADLAHRVEVMDDASIDRGGCAAVVGALRIDAQMQGALERVRAAVRS
ncbi:MAG: fliH [Ilumatobacteraceae bacterium]|nr:fliH [Ilumatobacteraceae bacterium]MCU1388826.1 fliH [Ilumatobacteraceae bacterium]